MGREEEGRRYLEIRHLFPRRIKRVQQRNSNKHNYYFLFSFIHPSSIHSPTHPLLSLLTLSPEPKNIDSVSLPNFPFSLILHFLFPSCSSCFTSCFERYNRPKWGALSAVGKKNVDFSCWCQRVLCRCHFDDDEGGAADEQGAAQLQTSNNSRPWLDAVAPLPCRAIHLNERGALIGPDRHRPLHPTKKEKKKKKNCSVRTRTADVAALRLAGRTRLQLGFLECLQEESGRRRWPPSSLCCQMIAEGRGYRM